MEKDIVKANFTDKKVNVVDSDSEWSDLVDDFDLAIYLPDELSDNEKKIVKFERFLSAMKKADKKIIFVGCFADQEDSPYVIAPFYAYAIRRLAASRLDYSIVKTAVFADPLIPEMEQIVKDHKLTDPLGAHPVSFITENDAAHAIAALAIEPSLRDRGQIYTLTMEENYNLVQLAYIMTRATEIKIIYQPNYGQKRTGSLRQSSLIEAGAKGLLTTVTDDFKRITGREPEELEHYLRNAYQISRLNAFSKSTY